MSTEVPLVKGLNRLVIVGGSLGAARVAEEARRIGFQGSIVIIAEEAVGPYDRPPLSKQYLTDVAVPQLDLIDCEALGVSLMTGTRATALDARNRRVKTTSGEVEYDALVIATGAAPREFPLGAKLNGVTNLRSIDDARRIREALQPGAQVVVIGAGFIGGEVASSARSRGADVTMVEMQELPLVGAVGSLVAERLAMLHRQYDVDLRTRTKVRAIEGSDRVEKVVLSDGSTINADLVVVGVGVEPNTGWLRGSGIAMSDGVACSPYLESTVPGVYALGDVARWVNPWSGHSTRMEHWTAVGEQAVAVARNALSTEREECSVTPYFWSEWYGHKLQMMGECAEEAELNGDSSPTAPFVAQYRYDGNLVGAFALDRTGPLMKLRGAIAQRASWESMLEARARVAR